MVKETDIAWLAGIVDGEGCFSVKRPVQRGNGRRKHQVWLVICNTSRSMMDRAQKIMTGLGAKTPPMRRVWKGAKATRWQYWLNLCGKDDLLHVTKCLLPHLTAKRVEATVVVWHLERACAVRAYKNTPIDIAMLESLSLVKRNGGEAPAEVANLFREVIPSEATEGTGSVERVETRGPSPNSNDPQERPAPAVKIVRR